MHHNAVANVPIWNGHSLALALRHPPTSWVSGIIKVNTRDLDILR